MDVDLNLGGEDFLYSVVQLTCLLLHTRADTILKKEMIYHMTSIFCS